MVVAVKGVEMGRSRHPGRVLMRGRRGEQERRTLLWDRRA